GGDGRQRDGGDADADGQRIQRRRGGIGQQAGCLPHREQGPQNGEKGEQGGAEQRIAQRAPQQGKHGEGQRARPADEQAQQAAEQQQGGGRQIGQRQGVGLVPVLTQTLQGLGRRSQEHGQDRGVGEQSGDQPGQAGREQILPCVQVMGQSAGQRRGEGGQRTVGDRRQNGLGTAQRQVHMGAASQQAVSEAQAEHIGSGQHGRDEDGALIAQFGA